jgi:hypothetical protein
MKEFSEKKRRLKGGGSHDWLPHRAAEPDYFTAAAACTGLSQP